MARTLAPPRLTQDSRATRLSPAQLSPLASHPARLPIAVPRQAAPAARLLIRSRPPRLTRRPLRLQQPLPISPPPLHRARLARRLPQPPQTRPRQPPRPPALTRAQPLPPAQPRPTSRRLPPLIRAPLLLTRTLPALRPHRTSCRRPLHHCRCSLCSEWVLSLQAS